MVPYKGEWYFWHIYFPEYEDRMQAMSEYCNSYFAKYVVEHILKLVPKE